MEEVSRFGEEEALDFEARYWEKSVVVVEEIMMKEEMPADNSGIR